MKITAHTILYPLVAILAIYVGILAANNLNDTKDKWFCFVTGDHHGIDNMEVSPTPLFCEPYGYEDEDHYYSANMSSNSISGKSYRDTYRKADGTMLLRLIKYTPDEKENNRKNSK